MTDTPLTEHNNAILALELAAINAYRSAFPAGIPWGELHEATRIVWMEKQERGL